MANTSDPLVRVHLQGIIGAIAAHIEGREEDAIGILDAVNTELLMDDIEDGLEEVPAVLYDQDGEVER